MSTSTDTAPDSRPRTLLLLDGHSLAFRAFFAISSANFATSSGQHTNAVYGFFTQLIRLIHNERPTHLGVAFDVSRTSLRRTAEYPEYKATRSAPPPEWQGQMELIRATLDACGVFTAEKEGYEADDLIATLATQAAADDVTTYIATGDRDALQLVDDRITVLYPKQGAPQPIRYTPEEVAATYGVTPRQYPDLAALRGDPSDNLPGVPKVGEKTAAKWLNKYGSLEEIISRADEFTGKLGENLRAAIPDVQRNRKLTELVRDVPVEYSWDALQFAELDPVKVTKQLDVLEFGKDFRERLFTAFGTSSDAAVLVESGPAVKLDTTLVASDGFGQWIADHPAPRYGVGCTGDATPGRARLDTVTIAVPGGAAAYCDLAVATPDDETALAQFFADPQVAKVMHDSKAVRHQLGSYGWTLEGIAQDCSLAAYLVRPGQRTYDLEELVLRHLHRELHSGAKPERQMSLLDDAGSDTEYAEYAAESAYALLELADRLDTELEAVHATTLLHDMELPLAVSLYKCEAAGIAVDTAALVRLRDDFSDRATAAQQAAWDSIGDPTVNLSSPKQLQRVLFDELELPKTKKTKTGYTTDAKALEELMRTTEHPFLGAVLEYRDATKMKQTVEGLIKAVADDGRIHTTFRQNVAATGRLSSTDPNLQNIPVRTSDGRKIRAAFVVGEGYECLLTADYSQIEMRVMAHLSGDEGMIEAFQSGEDLHSYVGSQAFGVPMDEITPELRRRTKAMSYGLAYGLSAYGLAQQLNIGQGEAKAQMDAYFERFGGVRDFLHNSVEEARRTGYTETLLGRRRRLPELNSTNRMQREGAERAALNAPIQGTAADIIKIAMIRVDEELDKRNLRSRMLLQVHDELVAEIAPGELDEVTDVIVGEMDQAIALKVPLDVSVGTGRNWDEAGH